MGGVLHMFQTKSQRTNWGRFDFRLAGRADKNGSARLDSEDSRLQSDSF